VTEGNAAAQEVPEITPGTDWLQNVRKIERLARIAGFGAPVHDHLALIIPVETLLTAV
jgi:hypothetical protein